MSCDDAGVTHDPDAIIQRVLGPVLDLGEPDHLIRMGSRRAVLFVDEATAFLAPALREANFWAVSVPTGMNMADFETRNLLLAGRILVTRYTAAYVEDAPVLDYAVIGLDALPVLSTGEGYTDNPTVKLISRAVTRHRLASRPPAWVIMLTPGGEHTLVTLE